MEIVLRKIQPIQLEFGGTPASAVGFVSSRVINQKTTHSLRRDGQKVRSILPNNILVACHLQEELIHQPRGLKSVIDPLPPLRCSAIRFSSG